ncbi:MAG: S8 family serine peptidase [Meiothermus sp.]|nr:S8 family serine peptidase [Meiothermus sp.]
MIAQTLKLTLAVSLVALLAACGAPLQATSPGGSDQLLTIKLSEGDTQESIVQRYGGEMVAWLDDKAILKLSSEAVAQLQARGISMQNTTLAANTPVAAPVTAAGWNAWSGGWNAWSSGWNAWSGGWNAWSSGVGGAPPSENNTAWNQIRLREAHAISRRFGAGVKVAVLDTGIDTAHPMFSGRLAPSSEWRDFVSNDNNPQEVGTSSNRGFGHGTAAASIILQVAPKATILPIRVLNQDGAGSLDVVLTGITHAVNMGARVINVSLGSTSWSDALFDTAAWANSRGVYIYASTGNTGNNTNALFPANLSWYDQTYMKTVGIGSVRSDNVISSFTALLDPTNNGATDIYGIAPGESIAAAYPGSQTARVTGTSFAAPMFSGAAALAMSEAPSLTFNTVAEALWGSMNTNTPNPGITGARLLDVERLIRVLPGWTQPQYRIVNNNSNLCLDVASSSRSDGAVVRQETCNSDSSQRWRLDFAGGFYSLVNNNSAKVLEVSASTTADGGRVQQWGWVGANNQQWTLRPVGSVYELVARHSNKCVGISGGSLAVDASAVQWGCNGANNQRWRLQLMN